MWVVFFLRPTSRRYRVGRGPRGSGSARQMQPPVYAVRRKRAACTCRLSGAGQGSSWLRSGHDHVGEFHALQPFREIRNSSSTITIRQSIPWNAASITLPGPRRTCRGSCRQISGRSMPRGPRLQPCRHCPLISSSCVSSPYENAMLDAGNLADMDLPLVMLDDPVQVSDTHIVVFFCIGDNRAGCMGAGPCRHRGNPSFHIATHSPSPA